MKNLTTEDTEDTENAENTEGTTPETDAAWDQTEAHYLDGMDYYQRLEARELNRKLLREREASEQETDAMLEQRDEVREENTNLKLQLGLWEDGNLICDGTLGEIRLLEERIEEAQKELSSIHRWIDKNHADGFIDSLTYLQNLERVADNWYDRIDAIETDARRFVRERDEAREIAQQLINIASHCLGWHENANPETITEAIKRWNASTKK